MTVQSYNGNLKDVYSRLVAVGNDVDVRGPSLQAVLIHLTGRELRE